MPVFQIKRTHNSLNPTSLSPIDLKLRDFTLFECILICFTTKVTTNCGSCQKYLSRFCGCCLSNREQFAISPNCQWPRNDAAEAVLSSKYLTQA